MGLYVLSSNQIELVQVLIIFSWVMNRESKLELFLSRHTIVQYDKVKLEYYKVHGENLHLGTGGLFWLYHYI